MGGLRAARAHHGRVPGPVGGQGARLRRRGRGPVLRVGRDVPGRVGLRDGLRRVHRAGAGPGRPVRAVRPPPLGPSVARPDRRSARPRGGPCHPAPGRRRHRPAHRGARRRPSAVGRGVGRRAEPRPVPGPRQRLLRPRGRVRRVRAHHRARRAHGRLPRRASGAPRPAAEPGLRRLRGARLLGRLAPAERADRPERRPGADRADVSDLRCADDRRIARPHGRRALLPRARLRRGAAAYRAS